MSLTECPDCRLGFAEAESCPNCVRALRPGGPRAQADAQGSAFGRMSDGLLAALFLFAMAALAFVVLRGV